MQMREEVERPEPVIRTLKDEEIVKRRRACDLSVSSSTV
jgi:hypothetical protein